VLEPEALAQKVVDATTRLAGGQAGAFSYLAAHGERGGERGGELDHAVAGASHTELARELPALAAQTLTAHRSTRSGIRASTTLPAPPAIPSYLAVPVIGRSGRTIGVLAFGHARPGVFTDETARLVAGAAATAAIAMDNARLFQEAHDLIAALEHTNRELDQFAYVASHDLKAPLRGIANLSQWIEDDLGERMDDQTRTHIHLLRGRVIRLENLIGGILAYSRAGRDSSEVASIDVGALATDVWELLAPPATARLELAGPLPQLKTSRIQLQQILMNLIDNAIKHNADRPLTITVSAQRVGRRWEFAVADDGIGIAPEFADKIWGLFQTLERRDKVESTGIGLSVVRKIVESQGGRAWVESGPGRGATFRFTWVAEPDEVPRG
jgi:signal transduction histidine kinase